MYFTLDENPVSFEYWYYSVLFSFFWLVGIMIPWIYLTGDDIYPFLSRSKPICLKITILGTIALLNVFGCYLGDFLTNFNKN
jgi:hypothetical protein